MSFSEGLEAMNREEAKNAKKSERRDLDGRKRRAVHKGLDGRTKNAKNKVGKGNGPRRRARDKAWIGGEGQPDQRELSGEEVMDGKAWMDRDHRRAGYEQRV